MVQQRNYERDLTDLLVASLIYPAPDLEAFSRPLFIPHRTKLFARWTRAITPNHAVDDSHSRGFREWATSEEIRDLERMRWRKRRRKKKTSHALSGICITLVWRNAKDLFTFSILWTRMRPLLGLANRSPEMISNSFSSFLPSARSVNRSSTSIRA